MVKTLSPCGGTVWVHTGAFGLKNVSVCRANLSVVLKPQGYQVAALQESGVGISAQDGKRMLIVSLG